MLAGIAEDAREDKLVIRCKMVLWRWPREVSRSHGLPKGVVSLNNGNAPWVADRLFAVGQLDSDHSAKAKAKLTRKGI